MVFTQCSTTTCQIRLMGTVKLGSLLVALSLPKPKAEPSIRTQACLDALHVCAANACCG